MVIVTVLQDYPSGLAEDMRVVPLDVSRWAVLSGGSPAEQRRVARELRVLSRRRPTVSLAA